MNRGQALPLILGAWLALLLAVVAVFALGRVHLAAARAQTVADLAAVSAARGLPAGPAADGVPERVRSLAAQVTEGSGGRLVQVSIPAHPAIAVDVRVEVAGPLGTRLTAVARAGLLPGAAPAGPTVRARGGGYSGPLVHRDGRPMCPAVAAAYDLMHAAALADGVDLVVVSGFRSDAEQAVLFARHPDPRWVAPPGRSRHRDATELDLSQAGGSVPWLQANAGRFGFTQRYSWEPWHWGYLPGCGAGAGAGDAAGGGGALAVPAWVPAEYRRPVRAAAAAQGLQPSVLAALLRAESGFDPRAVSPAGAQGIAQFMPATAAGVGLADPFDPSQAIPAAAALLAGHLRDLGSLPLALAAYNAGAGAVRRHGGIPPYPETQGYVARILALAGGGAVGGGGVVLLRRGDGFV